MMGGDKANEENKPWSTYLQDMHEHELTYGSNAGADHTHNIPVTNDNLRLDLNQLYPQQNHFPNLNTIAMSSSMSNMYGQAFFNPQWNLDELPTHAHKTDPSYSSMSDQINNLVDTKEGTSWLHDKYGGDISFHKNHEGSKIDGSFLSLGIGNGAEVKSENGINCNVCPGEPHGAIFPHPNRFYDQNAIGSSSCPGHQFFDRFSNSPNEGVSTHFNNHFRSDYGSDAYPGSSQFHTLQKPLPNMLREYPKCNLENPWNLSYGGDTLGINWNHQKDFGGELATSSELFTCGTTSGLVDIGNIFPSSLGLESERPSVTTANLNRNQLVMPYMPTVESFSSEPIVCSSTRPRGSGTKQENAGKSPTFASVTDQAANQRAQLPKRELVQPDGKLISHAKDDGLSQASDTLGRSSGKRRANRLPPSAPRVQRNKITLASPVTYTQTAAPIPPAAPRGRPTKKTISKPITPRAPIAAPRAPSTMEAVPRTVLPSIAPKVDFTLPVAPNFHHTNVAVPSLGIPPIPNPPTLAPIPLPPYKVELKTPTVQSLAIPSISIPMSASFSAPVAPIFQHTNTTVPSLGIPPIPNPPTLAPIPLPAYKVELKTPTVRSLAIPSISIPTSASFVAPVAPNFQHTNITVPSLGIPPIPKPPTLAPFPLPAYKVELKTPAVQSLTIPYISNPTSASFAAPTIPPPPWAQLTRMKSPPPVVPTLPSIPSVAPVPPDSPPRIRWQDPDEFPPLMGEKCMICKRDLLFTAEGPVSQPPIPPAAAVLPCGHSFHDHCLHMITPQDQSTNPPCIPCAIGE